MNIHSDHDIMSQQLYMNPLCNILLYSLSLFNSSLICVTKCEKRERLLCSENEKKILRGIPLTYKLYYYIIYNIVSLRNGHDRYRIVIVVIKPDFLTKKKMVVMKKKRFGVYYI